jgi:hypothetical protein
MYCLQLRKDISWTKCNNLHRNVFCITSSSYNKYCFFFFSHEITFPLNTSGLINCTVPQCLQERKAHSVDTAHSKHCLALVLGSVFLSASRSALIVCLYIKPVSGVVMHTAGLLSYEHGQTAERETWVELGRIVWGTKMCLAARKLIVLLTLFSVQMGISTRAVKINYSCI